MNLKCNTVHLILALYKVEQLKVFTLLHPFLWANYHHHTWQEVCILNDKKNKIFLMFYSLLLINSYMSWHKRESKIISSICIHRHISPWIFSHHCAISPCWAESFQLFLPVGIHLLFQIHQLQKLHQAYSCSSCLWWQKLVSPINHLIKLSSAAS